jgi:TolA-binding protein
MKKIGLMVVAVALSLSVAASAGSTGGRSRTERSSSKSKTVSKDQGQSPKVLADQIAQIKQEHQAELNELQEIKRLATEEKATKTVEALNKVIGRRNLEFEKKIGPLQQKLNALQNPGPSLPKDTKTAPKKGPPR